MKIKKTLAIVIGVILMTEWVEANLLNLTKLEQILREKGDLDNDERLHPTAAVELPWEGNGDKELDWIKMWEGKQVLDSVSSFSGSYLMMLTTAIAKNSEAIDCQNHALRKWRQFSNTTLPLYRKNLDVNTWENRVYYGAYQFPLEIENTLIDEDGHKTYSKFTSKTLVRVDVKPTEWFVPSAVWHLRDASGEFGPFSEYMFSPRGWLNSITSGMIIVSDIQVVTKTTHGSGTITSPTGSPRIIAYVIKRLPIREPFCPCYNKKSSQIAFCIKSTSKLLFE